MHRERVQIGFFLLPEVCGLLPGFAMNPDIGHGVEPLLGGRIEDAEVRDVETGQEVFLT